MEFCLEYTVLLFSQSIKRKPRNELMKYEMKLMNKWNNNISKN